MNTTLCYIERDGCYLMLHRIKKEQDINAGKWIGIGGKFKQAETPEECMLREVQEETGIVPDHYVYRGIVTFCSDDYPTEYMHLFYATTTQEVSVECNEGVLAWVPKSEVTDLNLWEGDRIFLDLLLQDRPFFSLKLVYQGQRLVQAILDGETLQ